MKKVVVLLIIVIIGLSGYICYDAFIKNDEVKELKEEINSLKQKNTKLKEENKQDKTDVEDNVQITVSDLYGSYSWEKPYTNDLGNQLKYTVNLVLNSDGTATYLAGNGLDAEQTRGTYIYNDGKVIYTREYYNYENGQNDVYTDTNKTETFIVINKNTLQNTYYNQTTTLKKQ